MRRPTVILKKDNKDNGVNYIVAFFSEDIAFIVKFMKSSIRADRKNYQDVYY